MDVTLRQSNAYSSLGWDAEYLVEHVQFKGEIIPAWEAILKAKFRRESTDWPVRLDRIQAFTKCSLRWRCLLGSIASIEAARFSRNRRDNSYI